MLCVFGEAVQAPVGSKAQQVPAALGSEGVLGWGGWEHPEKEAQPSPALALLQRREVLLCAGTDRKCGVQAPGLLWLLRARKQQQIQAVACQKLGFVGAPLSQALLSHQPLWKPHRGLFLFAGCREGCVGSPSEVWIHQRTAASFWP